MFVNIGNSLCIANFTYGKASECSFSVNIAYDVDDDNYETEVFSVNDSFSSSS